jgi:tetratricopeptide (TPR) repeat protein
MLGSGAPHQPRRDLFCDVLGHDHCDNAEHRRYEDGRQAPSVPKHIRPIGCARRSLSGYNNAVGLAPKDARAWGFRGDIFNAKGEEDRAIQVYIKAIGYDPNWMWPLEDRASICEKRRQWDLALPGYGRVIELAPESRPRVRKSRHGLRRGGKAPDYRACCRVGSRSRTLSYGLCEPRYMNSLWRTSSRLR